MIVTISFCLGSWPIKMQGAWKSNILKHIDYFVFLIWVRYLGKQQNDEVFLWILLYPIFVRQTMDYLKGNILKVHQVLNPKMKGFYDFDPALASSQITCNFFC